MHAHDLNLRELIVKCINNTNNNQKEIRLMVAAVLLLTFGHLQFLIISTEVSLVFNHMCLIKKKPQLGNN